MHAKTDVAFRCKSVNVLESLTLLTRKKYFIENTHENELMSSVYILN